jgi:hypothetical protein
LEIFKACSRKDRGWRAHRERAAKENGLRLATVINDPVLKNSWLKLPGTSSFSDRLISQVLVMLP